MNSDKHPGRTTVTISVDTETKRRLKKVAQCNHMTVSAMITAWAWQKTDPVIFQRKQMTMNENYIIPRETESY